jgi:hypothetical protein
MWFSGLTFSHNILLPYARPILALGLNALFAFDSSNPTPSPHPQMRRIGPFFHALDGDQGGIREFHWQAPFGC